MPEAAQVPDPPPGLIDPATYTSIIDEHNVERLQRDVRKKLLVDLEAPKFNGEKKAATIGHISHDSLTPEDIPVFGNLLLKIGDVETLNLILHSPGGDGTVVETVVSLLRTHCKKLRAIIPTSAKSAATLICLGADEIVMGSPSELGPIDAQIPIQVSGVRRYASAQSFIDARDTLLKKHADAVQAGEETAGILQMIASLDLPFIVECERLMDFGRDVGKKLLVSHMFSRKTDKDTKADTVVNQLSSVQLYKVHGRTINGQAAKKDLGLTVKLCGDDDPFWRKVWEWYIRAEILMGRQRAAKLFESRDEILLGLPQPIR